MGKETIEINVTLQKKMLKEIDDRRRTESPIPSRSKTIRGLISMGLSIGKEEDKK